MSDHVIVDLNDGVARLVLNDPASRNALSLDMVSHASRELERILPEARVLVISGAGDHFCAGANLKKNSAGVSDPSEDAELVRTHFSPLIASIKNSPIPVVTAVKGAAAGFGASLALTGDVILAGRSAFFLQAFCHVGLIPDGGSATTLVRAIGRVRATGLMLLGDRLPAQNAFEWGLITKVVEDDALDDEVETMAHRLANGPTVALGLIRKMAWDCSELSYADQLEAEYQHQLRCVQTHDYKEGADAFREKRRARFLGR